MLWSRGRSHEWIVEGTARDARAFEARKRLELEARPAASRASPTISVLCDRYAEHAARTLGADTWRRSRIYQLARVRQHFGRLRLADLTLAEVEAFKTSRLEAVLPTTVNNELDALRALLRWARTNGHAVPELSPANVPNRRRPRVTTWTEDEVAKIYEAAASVAPRLVPMLVFGLNTGCRKGEIIAAEWSWIDVPAALIRIPATREWQPKSGKAREVPLSDDVRDALAVAHEHPRWLFPTDTGTRRRWWPQEWWDETMLAASVKGHPHMMRHTFASHFLRSVPDLFLLSRILGHSHSRTTELYSHLLPDHLARARNAVRLVPKTMAATMADDGDRPNQRQK